MITHFEKFGYRFDLLDSSFTRMFDNISSEMCNEDSVVKAVWGVCAGTRIIDREGCSKAEDMLTRCYLFPVIVHTSSLGVFKPFVKISKLDGCAPAVHPTKKYTVRISGHDHQTFKTSSDALNACIKLVGMGKTAWGSDTEISMAYVNWGVPLERGMTLNVFNIEDSKYPAFVGTVSSEDVKIPTYVTTTYLTDAVEMSRNMATKFQPFVGRFIKVTIEDAEGKECE